jgi:hypothetical protein
MKMFRNKSGETLGRIDNRLLITWDLNRRDNNWIPKRFGVFD